MNYSELNGNKVTKANFDQETGLPTFHPAKIDNNLWVEFTKMDYMAWGGVEMMPRKADLVINDPNIKGDSDVELVFSIQENDLTAVFDLNVSIKSMLDMGIKPPIHEDDYEHAEVVNFSFSASGWEVVALL